MHAKLLVVMQRAVTGSSGFRTMLRVRGGADDSNEEDGGKLHTRSILEHAEH